MTRERPPGHAQDRRQARGRARDGLTRQQAEAELRRLMATVQAGPVGGERLGVAEVARRFAPFFRGRSLEAIRSEDVYDLVAVLETGGLSPESIRNVIGKLSAL